MEYLQITHGINRKRKPGWITCIVYSVLFLFLIFCLYAERVNKGLSDSLIRLHIVANSDSDTDQDLKLRVRDAVIAHMQERVLELKSKENAKTYVSLNTQELESIANETIRREGASEKAKVTFGTFPFPTKYYGHFLLPAGYYEALKIEIGEARGQNWWCVMFPPLCFVDDTKGELDDESVAILKNELTDNELELVLGSGEEVPVEIKFKIVELFQGTRIKIASLFRGIIKTD